MKLKNEKFAWEDPSGGPTLIHNAIVTVDGNGTFSLSIPEAFKDVIKGRVLKHGKTNYYLTGSNLAFLKKELNDLANQYMACTKTEQEVIKYKIESGLSYVKDYSGEDPNIYANGYLCPDDMSKIDSKYNWKKDDTPSFSKSSNAISIEAIVCTKIITVRGDHTKVEYERLKRPNLSFSDFAGKLNAFTDMGWLISSTSKSIKEIPYTEASAEFFYRSIEALCLLDRKIDEFFCQDNVDDLIRSSASFLSIEDKKKSGA